MLDLVQPLSSLLSLSWFPLSEAITKYHCWTGLWSVLGTGHAWAYLAIHPSKTLMFSPCIPVDLHLLWSSLLPMHFLAFHFSSSLGIVPETSFQQWHILLNCVDLSLLHCVIIIVYLHLILGAMLGACLVLFWSSCPYCRVLSSSNQYTCTLPGYWYCPCVYGFHSISRVEFWL